MRLISDERSWDHDEFEAAVEGMCQQIKDWPHERIAFFANTTPEVIFLFFAIWKLGKIACPINTRLPSYTESELFTPHMPSPLSPTPWDWNEGNLATMLYTSGSSGKPKIACHSIGNHLYNARGSQMMIPLDPSDRWLLSLPLFHVGGIAILFRCYIAKAAVVISSKFDGITHLSLVSTQLQRMLKNKTPAPDLKCILLGGGPIAHFEAPWKVMPTYGLTEMSSQVVTANQIHPYAEMKLAEDGEILVRGKILFKGYWENELIPQEGWFATKDLGRWHEGKFEVLGRKDNMFISGGENIQPEEIEKELCNVEGITQAVVVSVPDVEFGARPVAFIDDSTKTNQAIEILRSRLPKYKIPIRFYPLPQETGLKPSRKHLQELARNGNGLS